MSKPEYLTKQLAADALGLSPRRLLEISQTGSIQRKYTRDPVTKRRQAIFRTVDVRRMARELASRKSLQVGSAGRSPLRTQAGLARGSNLSPSAGRSHLQALSPAFPPTDESQRPWLTLDEAADYTGLPASFLSSMIIDGKLPALDVGVRPGGRWRVSRRDLDQIAGETQV